METLIATATFGLEAIVSRELEALGYEPRTTRPGWLSFRGDATAIARSNLWLRVSDRVLIEMNVFQADDFGVLFDETRATPWERFLPANASFPVRGRSVKSKLSSVPACQRIVKKAIVERLKQAHKVQTLPEDGPSFPVEVALLKDQATLTLDTSGAGLHKRGYRPLSGQAPLKETLAAGLILLSFWDRERPFLDPFCGTGTLPIEAALIARHRAPGILREFASESWPSLPARVWADAREEARSLETPPSTLPIRGSDHDADALALARSNAIKAGVAEDIRFEQKPFDAIRSDDSYGCLVANPPYGDRLGETSEARELYRSMPSVLRQFKTWSHYILTSSRELEALFGQKADRRRKLYNGRIECTYYQFIGPRPGGKPRPGRQAAFGGMDEKGERQSEIFANRLKKRARHLRKWPTKRGIDAYRLYDRDIKEVPLSVDRYGDFFLVTPAGEHVTSRTTAQHEDWLDEMVRAIAASLDVPSDHIDVVGRPTKERSVEVHENGLTFEIHLNGSDDTGLALEARVLRQKIRELATGKRVLCVESTSGGAGAEAVAAAAGGAESVTCVNADVTWAERNFALNALQASRHAFQRQLDASNYELIIVMLKAAPDEIVPRARALLTEDGVLYAVVRGHQRLQRLNDAEDVTESDAMLPEDFRSRRRLRFWKISGGGRDQRA